MCIDRCPIVLTLVVNCCCCESTATTNMTMTGDAISEHTSTADAGHTTTATRSQQSLEHWCRLSSTWFKHQPIMQVRTTITTQYNTTHLITSHYSVFAVWPLLMSSRLNTPPLDNQLLDASCISYSPSSFPFITSPFAFLSILSPYPAINKDGAMCRSHVCPMRAHPC